MTFAGSIFLIAVGAILRFAVADSIDEVELLVAPYMHPAPAVMARVGEMDRLKVVQLLSAGYDGVVRRAPCPCRYSAVSSLAAFSEKSATNGIACRAQKRRPLRFRTKKPSAPCLASAR